jgi:LPXTG-motif cell wall-anchored protein
MWKKALLGAPLLVGLAYKDPFNTGFERSETVVMPLDTAKEAKRLGLVPGGRSSLWTIAALAALAGGAWLLIRRRRKAVRKAA